MTLGATTYIRPPSQGKNNVCFAKGHPQLIRTVRRAEDGVHYELVSSGEIMSAAADGHFYYRIKPGSVRERDHRVMRRGII